MRVCIAGGTGFVGTRLATELVERGQRVTVLARNPEDADLPTAADRVAADVTDAEAVAAAVEGHDAVVNLVALSPLFEPAGGNERHFAVHRDGTANLVRAASEAGADRFVQMSALGADPQGPTAYLRAKGEAERIVRDSDLNWTVVRPSVVFGDGGEFVSFTRLLTTPYVTGLPGGGRTRFQPICVGDLAPMLAAMVVEDGHTHRTYELGGPEVLTLADVARLAHRAEGRSLRVLPVPMPLARAGLIVAGWLPFVPMGPDQYRSLQLDNVVATNDVTAFGRDPADLRTFADSLGLADGSDGDDTPRRGPAERATVGSLFVSKPVLFLFAFLTLTNLLPAVVDIYASPIVRWLFVPSYVVSLFVYEGFGLELAANAAARALPVDGHLVWEAGKFVTFYLVSVLLGGAVHLLGGRNRPPDGERVDG